MSQSPVPISAQTPPQTLRAVLRTPPELAPGDSLQRFAQLVRYEPAGRLPVVSTGRLCGILSDSDLVWVLQSDDPELRAANLRRAVSEYMRLPGTTLRAQMTVPEIERVFADTGETMLAVVDDDDMYLGVVIAHDLIVPNLPAPRPARVGGMATPFGVYLTDGTIQAGVGNFALIASGVAMTLLMLSALGILAGVFQLASMATGYSIPLLVPIADDVPVRGILPGLASVGQSILFFALFMVLMRTTGLAGYHAAEHQTVHAIERCELLEPDIVRRMPRAHPRCGTNIMAAVLIFTLVREALLHIPALSGLPELMAAVTALFTWRPVGTFLQEWFTTRPARDSEVRSGIAAGTTLLNRYLMEAPRRPSLLRRIWCSGLPQVVIGMGACIGIASALMAGAEPIRRLILGN